MPRKIIATILASTLGLAPALASAQCFTAVEHAAFQVRALQTELMVAALSCRDVPGRDFMPDYGAFVKKHSGALSEQSRALRAYFVRSYGREQAETHLDRFVTGLANDVSRRSMTATYCDESMALFKEAATVDRRNLTRFAATQITPTTSVEVCQAAASNPPAPARKP